MTRTTDPTLRILQVSRTDFAGGADLVARGLHETYLARGRDAWLAVANRRSTVGRVLHIPERGGRTLSVLRAVESRSRVFAGAARAARPLTHPRQTLDRRAGRENFDFPGTWRLLELPPAGPPDIVHLHNLHGEYFDLRALPALSAAAPTVVTMHDAWMLAGHCAHSFDCERWLTGCGDCPDLTIYPAVRRDATALNWRNKREIYRSSRLFVATPSRWLMERVGRSMLSSAVVESRVIPYGIDLGIFRPAADRSSVRAALGLGADVCVVLFAANGIRENMWKDFDSLRAALPAIARSVDRDVVFLALGEDAPPERVGTVEIRFVPFVEDRAEVARYYQAADVYVHPARADTFPNAVLEALACGVPAVATAIGGIPEQIVDLVTRPRKEATGILTPPRDTEALAEAVTTLLRDDDLRLALGTQAAADAAFRFDQNRQTDDYLRWYEAMSATRRNEREPAV